MPFFQGVKHLPDNGSSPANSLSSFHPTTTPNVFIGAVRKGGIVKLTIQPNSCNVRVEPLGINPLLDDKIGGGPHPAEEVFNDGKVSPDGHFFVGTLDYKRLFGNKDDIRQYFWTMDGHNAMAPLLYKIDL